jgi:pilus assembly protein CpaF
MSASKPEPPWLEGLLADPGVTDICLNGARSVHADRGRGLEPVSLTETWSEEDMRIWLLDRLSAAGRSWDARHPFVDAALPSGHRLHAAFPPLARAGILVSLRRLASASPQAVEAGHARWGRSPAYGRLLEAVRRGESVLVAGGTGSGKTTLANDLLSAVPPLERIIALEDTPELAPAHPHFLSLVSRPPNADGCGEVTLRTLLRQALRMRPDRIVLGECRGPEVLDLLQIINTGHRGAMATLHANSPRDALRRAELLCLIAGEGSVPIPAIRELLAAGVQWLVQVERGRERAITELWRVEGREGDTILLRPVLHSAHGQPACSSGVFTRESEPSRDVS